MSGGKLRRQPRERPRGRPRGRKREAAQKPANSSRRTIRRARSDSGRARKSKADFSRSLFARYRRFQRRLSRGYVQAHPFAGGEPGPLIERAEALISPRRPQGCRQKRRLRTQPVARAVPPIQNRWLDADVQIRRLNSHLQTGWLRPWRASMARYRCRDSRVQSPHKGSTAQSPVRVDGSIPICKVAALCAKHGTAANINKETNGTKANLFIVARLSVDPQFGPSQSNASMHLAPRAYNQASFRREAQSGCNRHKSGTLGPGLTATRSAAFHFSRRPLIIPPVSVRLWRNWQTHQLEGLALAIAWWFESTQPHQSLFFCPRKDRIVWLCMSDGYVQRLSEDCLTGG